MLLEFFLSKGKSSQSEASQPACAGRPRAEVVKCQRSVVKCQRSEVRSQLSNVKGQMSDVRGQKSVVSNLFIINPYFS
ncbi:MAG: hypothetical protein Q8P20_04290 [bacterium]|nr:hypothetical protein [bacterium]